MFKNYLKTAFRNFQKNKAYSFINITGLTFGLASCLIIFQFVIFEYSFDHFNTNKDHLYRVLISMTSPGEEESPGAFTSMALAPSIQQSIPEVEFTARFHPEYTSAVVTNPDNPQKVFEEEQIFYADSSFINMFTYPIIKGTGYLQKGTMLISESAAEKYFGRNNPVGQVLNVVGQVVNEYKITGVFKDVPDNSHLQFNMLLPMQDLLSSEQYINEPEGGWSWNNFITYVQLKPGADAAEVNSKLTALFYSYRDEYLKRQNWKAKVQLQPLADIHLNEKIDGPHTNVGSKETVYFFSIIGIVLLLIALINYINLSTARSVDRSKEVGVRKAIGAVRKQLIFQFLCESALTNLFAGILAIAAVEVLVPLVNSITGTNLSGIAGFNPMLWLVFLGALIISTFLAGLYPAFMLSAYKPVWALKGRTESFGSHTWLRKVLVVAQFTASVILIGGTAIVYDQLNYMRQRELGLTMNHVISVIAPRVLPEGTDDESAVNLFKQRITMNPEVVQAAGSWSIPGTRFNWNGASVKKAEDDPANSITGVVTYTDTSFFNLYGFKLKAGSSVREIAVPQADTTLWPVLCNETAAKNLGYTAHDALGKFINIGQYTAVITGVFNDFNWTSAHLPPRNVFFGYSGGGRYISLQINSSDLTETVNKIQAVYEELFPGNVFNYAFADEKFDEQYKDDQEFADIFTLFSGLAIIIACLGLFGLAAFTIRKRTKEIGIRKILGASAAEIVILLSKEFLILITAAILIASPAVYFLMNGWLEEYAYRITIGPGIFLLTASIIIIIALLTVSFQSVRAALTNPAENIKYE